MFTLQTVESSQENRNEVDRLRLSRIAEGDEAALWETYDLYAQHLYSFALRILRSVDDAEDIVHDVFIKVWKSPHVYIAEHGTVYTWLVSMAHHRAIERFRSKNLRSRFFEIDMKSLTFISDARSANMQPRTELGEDQRIITEALSRLNLDYQLVLSLGYYEGFHQAEIAKKLDIPVATVQSRLRKALLSLQSILKGKV